MRTQIYACPLCPPEKKWRWIPQIKGVYSGSVAAMNASWTDTTDIGEVDICANVDTGRSILDLPTTYLLPIYYQCTTYVPSKP